MSLSTFARGIVPRRALLAAPPLARTSLPRPTSSAVASPARRQFSSSPCVGFNATLASRGFFGGNAAGTAASTSSPLPPTGKEATDPSAQVLAEPQATTASLSDSAAEAAANTASSSTATAAAETHAHPALDAVVALDPTTATSHLDEAAAITRTFAEIDHSWWPNVAGLEYALNLAAETTGAPWWAVIVGVTVAARVVLLPLVIGGHKRSIRMANVSPQVKELSESMKAAKQNGNQAEMMTSMTRMQQIFQQNDCHPAKMFVLPLTQGTFFASFFFAIRRLADGGLAGLHEGVAFLPSLAHTDPTWVLPIAAAGASLAVIETGAELGASAATSSSTSPDAMRKIFRFILPLSVFYTATLPSAVFFFWLTNNAYSLLQLVAFSSKPVQRLLGMPARIQHPSTAPVKSPKKGGKGGIFGFIDNVKTGYNTERRRYLASVSNDNTGNVVSHTSSIPQTSDRNKAYEKWLKPAQQAVSSSPKTSPRNDLFESDAAAQASPSSPSSSPAHPTKKAATPKSAASQAAAKQRRERRRRV